MKHTELPSLPPHDATSPCVPLTDVGTRWDGPGRQPGGAKQRSQGVDGGERCVGVRQERLGGWAARAVRRGEFGFEMVPR